MKLSRANIKKQTVLIEECKACYETALVPLPREFVKSVTTSLHKIRNAAALKVSNDARNAVSNAARSALSKRANDPDQHLDEAEQVKYEKYRASTEKEIANVTDLRKRNANPKVILGEGEKARMKKRQVLDDKGNATKKAKQDAIKTMAGRMTKRNADSVHGNCYELPIDGQTIIADKLTISALTMDFGGQRNANVVLHLCFSLFHFSHTPPAGMQMVEDMVRDEKVFKKALVPATWLEEGTIQGRPLLPGGVPHLKEVDEEKMANEVWATPDFVGGMSFIFRHHDRFYKLVSGAVFYAYLIFDTNTKFDLFAQHTHWKGIGLGCELLCRAKDDEFIEPDACIEVTIGDDVSFENAKYRLIRNDGDMDTVLNSPIPR